MVDAVVIGAGHNGLAAAAMLAEAGWRVAVFERADRPGGAVKTREVTLPGFRHDMGAMNLSLFAGSAFHARFAAQLTGHGLAFVPVRDCFATAFPDRRWFGVSTDLDLTAARVAGFSVADAVRWRAMVAEFGAEAAHVFSVLGAPATASGLARRGFDIWRKGGTATLRRLGKLFLSSPRAFLDANFESDRVKAALAAWGMHLDFPPDQAGGAVFPWLEAMANQSFGMVLGQGGADTMIRALVGMIEAKGGKVECGVTVREIMHDRHRAQGVWLSDGRLVLARRAVIANVGPRALAGLLPKGTGDDGFDAGARGFVHAPGTMMLHLAMDDLPDWAAGRELRRFAYVHLAPSLRMMTQASSDAVSGLLPAEPVLVVGQPTTVDPSRAPAGKHVLWVQVRMVPAVIRGDAAGRIATTDWAEAREAMAERVLDILDRYAPGTRERVLARHAVSPLDLEADNPNLVGGDQIGGSHHLSQNFVNRPLPGWADGATPLKQLHLVGAACWPGAGVGAGSGLLLADRLLKRRRRD